MIKGRAGRPHTMMQGGHGVAGLRPASPAFCRNCASVRLPMGLTTLGSTHIAVSGTNFFFLPLPNARARSRHITIRCLLCCSGGRATPKLCALAQWALSPLVLNMDPGQSDQVASHQPEQDCGSSVLRVLFARMARNVIYK